MKKNLLGFRVERSNVRFALLPLLLLFLSLTISSAFYAQTPVLELECQGDQILECGQDELEEPTVISTDISEAVVLTFVEEVLESDDCSTTYERVWTATAGFLTATCTEEYTVEDTMPPYFESVPLSSNLSCIEEIPAPENLIAGDDCDPDVFVEYFVLGDGALTDSCALSTAFGSGDDWSVWLPTLYDLGMAPTVSWNFQPGAYLLSYEDGTAEIYGVVENSDDSSLLFEVNLFFENGMNWEMWSSLGRTYKDDTGLATPEMLYEDWMYYEMVPDFSRLTGLGVLAGSELYLSHAPASYYFGFQCGEAANNKNGNDGFSGWFSFEGNYMGVDVSGSGDVNVDKQCFSVPEATCVNDYALEYLYRAEDDCGNMAFANQEITVLDEEAPVFTVVPEDLVLNCEEWPIPVFEGVEAVDNCDSGLESLDYIGEFIVEESTCYSEYVRRWEAIDFCGNVAEWVQTIIVQDVTPPVFNFVPEDFTIECDQEINMEMATATDNCSIPEVSVEEVTTGDSCETIITRTFTATDDCDNTVTAVQVITVVDTTPPVFDDYEMQIFVSCEEVDDVPLLTATDNCNEFDLTYEEFQLSGGCMGTVHRVFTATDICGNTTTVEQYIVVTDMIPPAIDNPEDATVECDNVPATPGADGIDITDNCALEVDVTFEETITDGPCEDSYTITWVWTATDYCGNMSEATTVITVVDTTNPEWVEETLPMNVTIECDMELPEVVLPEATDNCDDDVLVEVSTETIEEGDCPYNYTVTRVFRGVDNCGNEVFYAQVITVQDTTPPTLEVAQNITIECTDDVPAAAWTADDNCGEVTVEVTEVEAGDSCESTITRTYTATDECGNMTMDTQVVTIVDTTAPSVMPAGDVTIECTDDVPAPAFTTEDNCNEVTVEVTEVTDGDSCETIIVRTYVPTDACGNVGEAMTQVITILDTTAPMVFPAADLELDCTEAIPAAAWTTEDNCNEVTVEVTEETTGDSCETIIVRTYVPTDACGNVGDAMTQTITITDTTAPIIVAAGDVTVECDQELPAPSWEASDDCSEYSVEVEAVIVNGDCPQEYVMTRTYTATDVCGNESTDTQVLTVVDTTAPMVFPAADVTIECTDEIPAAAFTTEDNCGEVTVEITEVEAGDSCESTIMRTYVPTDECGNVGEAMTQVITIVDTTAPVVFIPADYTQECDLPVEEPIFTTEDNCNEVTVEVMEDINDEDPCEVIITRTYVPTDACGNVGEAMTQIITLIDTTAPVIDPYEMVIEIPCEDSDELITITATDNCQEVEISYVDLEVSGSCPFQVVRTYTVTDGCGNSVTTEQILFRVDETAPEFISFPEDVTIECDEEMPSLEEAEDMIEIIDNCSEAEWMYLGMVTVEGECPQNYTIEHSWSAIDECLNENVQTWTITIQDTTAPMIEVAGDLTIECTEDVPPAAWTAEDNCGEVTVEVVEIEAGDSCESTITRTYTATDECGNMTVDTQVITIVDSTAPSVMPAGDMIIECTDMVPVPEFTADDNCNEVTVEITEVTTGDSCETIITRTYIPTDACGNVGEAMTQTITILDTTAPSVTPAADVTIECTEEIPASDWTSEDNCNDVTVEVTEETSGDSCETIITRTYVPIDACGNIGEAMIQVITILDTTAPLIEVGGDVTIECDENLPEPMFATSDACNEVTVDIQEEIVFGDCDQAYIMTRTYTATDACGNSTTDTQILTVQDTTPPSLTIGGNITIECTEDIPEPVFESIDNCGLPTVEIVETVSGDSCEEVLTREFTSTDECGNTTSATQVITIVDTQAPSFTFIPEGGIFECDEPLPNEMATAEDACNDVTISSTEIMTEGSCPQSSSITITWTATDDCGNATSAVTIYTIQDTTVPVIETVLEDVVYECTEDVPSFDDWEATDNCDPNPSIETVWEYLTEDECGNFTALVTCIATDACGNTSSSAFNVTVQDETAPEFEMIPLDLVLDCDDEIPAAEDLVATDNCIGDVTITVDDEYIGDLPDPEAELDCAISTPVNNAYYEEDWGLLLDLGGWEYYTIVEGEFLQYEDGTAHFIATFQSVSNPEGGFYADVHFIDGMDWVEWTSQSFPTDYKDDFDLAGDNYLDWTYYILNGGMANLTGWGDLAGSSLNLAHAPSNYYYGFQIGVAGNNVNTNYGGGGWFTFEGTLIDASTGTNMEVDGAGDLAWDADCCPEYTVERTYCAVDCSGNETCFTQTISFEDLDGIIGGATQNDTEVAHVKSDFDLIKVVPNPSDVQSYVEFKSNVNDRVWMEVYNSNGQLEETIYNSRIHEGVSYRVNVETVHLTPGIYTLRLSSHQHSDAIKMIVVR